MAEHCRDCGAELAVGQRFCRRCGLAVARPSSEDVPTKVFRPEAQPNTPTMPSLLSTPATAQVYGQPTARQSPPTQREASYPAPPSQGKSRWLRYLLFIMVGLVASVVLLGIMFARLARRYAATKSKTTAPASAPVKAGVNNPSKPAALMSEEGATVTEDQTIIKGTYPLGANASISLMNLTGKIKIEGWDESQAEVRVIKEGGSEQDRQAVQIKLDAGSDRLSLETSPTRSSPVEVHYEIKLPRR